MSSSVILTLNAGSSSLKFALFPRADEVPRKPLLAGLIEWPMNRLCLTASNSANEMRAAKEWSLTGGTNPHQSAVSRLLDWLPEQLTTTKIVAVGHRVVHGGQLFSSPAVLTAPTFAALKKFVPLAPLHQPHNLAGIEAAQRMLPEVPQVACFDTAFHRSQTELQQRYALPRAITEQGIRRYGFHGLSYEYIAGILPEKLPRAQADGRVIVAHLGNGASLCAMHQRRSMATTMGFSTADGLMMGTRSGSLDPGVIFYLLEHAGMSASEISHLIYQESGLLGVSGISSDMRTLLASPSPEAREAIDMFCDRIVREIGSMAATLGGLDALIFTAGIGNHAPQIRSAVCSRLDWLDVEMDDTANNAGDELISCKTSRVSVWNIPTNEEWVIASHTARLTKN